MNRRLLANVLYQLNKLEENESREGASELTPEEAEELAGGTVNGGCPISGLINTACPGNSACGGTPA
ncbi:hypothetical protein M0L20_25680 [Spirosoma sp. RP8]|uniref:Bacteriocin n=1 Tax=Spirosoma liriopis TaxID=2937440 RepID=A0ABT0HSY3_9BACT|nr:hypothetical protein [Spirosoma liriopis]MCK8495284.1 hypothetical protein [Spirosoma liriopis]